MKVVRVVLIKQNAKGESEIRDAKLDPEGRGVVAERSGVTILYPWSSCFEVHLVD